MEMFHYEYMHRALLAGSIISIVLGLTGIFVVLKRMSFIGVGISHSAFGGIAFGYLAGLDPILCAVVFSFLVGILIAVISKSKKKLEEDTLIGVFFSLSMALGILFIGLRQGYNVDLFGYLFGSILTVSIKDLIFIGVAGVLILGTILVFLKELVFYAFDEDTAFVMGIKINVLRYVLLGLISLSVVISIKIAGIILVSALLVIPSAISVLFAKNFRQLILLSTLIAIVCTIGGLFLSYYIDVASGATIVICLSFVFFVSLFIKR